MKIVNREVFLDLPAGTVYAKYYPTGTFDEICIKADTIAPDDWAYQTLIEIDTKGADPIDCFLKLESDPSFEVGLDHNCSKRDGLYDDELFAIFSKDDAKKMMQALNAAIAQLDGEPQ